jgi:hypothetical protein
VADRTLVTGVPKNLFRARSPHLGSLRRLILMNA